MKRKRSTGDPKINLEQARYKIEQQYEEKKNEAYELIEAAILDKTTTTDNCPECKEPGFAACKGMFSALCCKNKHHWWPSENVLFDPKKDPIACSKERLIGLTTLNKICADQLKFQIENLRLMANDLEKLIQ